MTEKHIALLRKLIDARLTKGELEQVKLKVNELITNRKPKDNQVKTK